MGANFVPEYLKSLSPEERRAIRQAMNLILAAGEKGGHKPSTSTSDWAVYWAAEYVKALDKIDGMAG